MKTFDHIKRSRIKTCARAFIVASSILLIGQPKPFQAGSFISLAQAQSVAPSEVSALSAVPIAMVVAAPSIIIGSGVILTVVTVQASARGTVWVLERA
jgi:hypothetical protein